jgi:glycosyltransferase involved in cell wall biosynthesis
MKIVLVHNTYREAGGEDVVFESERRLLERAGHSVTTYVRSNSELQDDSLIGRIAVVPRMLWSSETRQEFAAILDTVRPDVVHVHNTFMRITPSIYWACAERGIPVVQTLHNFRLLCPGGNLFRHGMICRECIDRSLLQSVRHGCYGNSRGATGAIALMLAFHRALQTYETSVARFITLTKFAKQEFVAAGFAADRLAVKPNFVDPDPGERSRHGDYALYVGRLVGNKGVHVLLSAWKVLRAQIPLQIVGDGPEHAALEEEVRKWRLSGITFRGQLSRNQVMETMKGARFIIVPSILHESFGNCVVESFACGTPVLCSRLGSLAELVNNHATGLHFNPGDDRDIASKAAWAWNHPSELERMGHAARASYETMYTPEKNYSLLMDIYEQAFATAGHQLQSLRSRVKSSAEHCNPSAVGAGLRLQEVKQKDSP